MGEKSFLRQTPKLLLDGNYTFPVFKWQMMRERSPNGDCGSRFFRNNLIIMLFTDKLLARTRCHRVDIFLFHQAAPLNGAPDRMAFKQEQKNQNLSRKAGRYQFDRSCSPRLGAPWNVRSPPNVIAPQNGKVKQERKSPVSLTNARSQLLKFLD